MGRYKGGIAWNKGLSKDTDERVASYGESVRISRLGRTKENDPSVASQAAKMRGRTKETHSGVASQAAKLTGRTKEEYPYLARMAEKLKGRTKENNSSVASQSAKMKGRTKETHPGIARQAEKMRGRTKETDEGIARSAEMKRGRTKENDDGIAAMAAKLRGRTKETHPYLAIAAEKKRVKKTTVSPIKGRTKENDPGIAAMAKKTRDNGSLSKEKNPAWVGGKSFEPYTIEFNEKLKERIRERDNHTCQLCGKTHNGKKGKLAVHHIDYDKVHSVDNNLITLCTPCNASINVDRVLWTNYFQRKMQLRFQCIVIDQVNEILEKKEVCINV